MGMKMSNDSKSTNPEQTEKLKRTIYKKFERSTKIL